MILCRSLFLKSLPSNDRNFLKEIVYLKFAERLIDSNLFKF
ncbi:hypothetical protein LEP1GSC021_2803 [Leptospira noguchii str. 1993005606]|uniref:Uncharacterized protein n=2 Tax=Leptospira noguchii TaxID=28182 RepID=M6YQF0_9LEPT|nr:hypothetical protein LEP1GSC035_1306 [Leptospira noguchii str. 2007001578]EMO88553.1 hypothetical protein LEP1GSC024_1310 [Leptospira noguchii str. 2001034031]EPE85111.1 hypothetical protein LEP1GSC021_2803 [Leptospira noguchii str. 1993005606]